MADHNVNHTPFIYRAAAMMTVLLLSGILLAGCTGKDGSFDLRKPYSLDLTPPEGPIEYETGWTDGCESGMSAYANNFYKIFGMYELRMNPELRQNRMYYQAWKDAFLYCAIFWSTTLSDKI